MENALASLTSAPKSSRWQGVVAFCHDTHGKAATIAAMSESASYATSASALEIKNILLVDDDVDLALALKGLLEAHNYLVTTVSNGAEALREVMGMDYDVIICDMMMPQMPGDMFYLAVQKTRPEMAKRFLFITGHGDNPKVNAFLKNNNGLVIYKPVKTGELVQMIAMVMQRAFEGKHS
jgi:DNA-binding response OmpR family regulator